MKKNTLILLIVVIIFGLAAALFLPVVRETSFLPVVFDPLNATYTIENQHIAFVNGLAQTEVVPGSAAKTVTKVFGVPVNGDLNGDGKPDAALMLTQESGGSGIFFYAAVALNGANGAEGTNAILLGDRVAPQNIEIKNGQVIANYAERNPGEPMTTQPSVGVSKYMVVRGTMLEANAIAGPGERCGGNTTTAPTCIFSYHCAPEPDSHLPFGDVGGTCVAD
jgi:hypothetical protein